MQDMHIIRHLIAVMLTVALLVTGQGMAFARTQTPAEGQMVLCLGHGSVTVYVDGDGQPTTAPHLCDDCAQALFAVLQGQSHLTLHSHAFGRLAVVDNASQHTFSVLRAGSARGPPFDVI